MKFLHYLTAISLTYVFSTSLMWGRPSVVPDYIRDSEDFELAYKFLDHYHELLKHSGIESVGDSLRQTRERGLKYRVGNDSRFKSLTGEEEFSLSLTDGLYSAQWRRDGNLLVECSFPSRIDLLTFSNKVELEDVMLSKLKAQDIENAVEAVPQEDMSKLRRIEYSPFYVRDLGYYITPRMSHQVVYQPLDSISNICELLVNSPKYPLECISNYMLTGYSPEPIAINLKMDRYGYQTESVTIDFGKLFRILSSEGSVPYWGVEEYDGDIVKGLYVWLNRFGGFAHIITIDIPVNTISALSKANARMHSYVRLDNLKSLFEEFQ
ncbi:MAG: hypothetical protein K2K75_10570 [Muribaculaceae bacterium]|nr:hypothetical protein [Muribaculaceae bacterium]